MANYKGVGYLRRKLNEKRFRVNTRYRYYEMKNLVNLLEMTKIPELGWLRAVLGWCPKSVDVLADRLVFREFKNDNFDFTEIYQLNNPDILFDSAILSALITSCCFIYISKDNVGFPRLQVIDGGNATGIIDPITNMLGEGYAVLERDNNGNPTIEAYFTKENTRIFRKGTRNTNVIPNPAPYPLLVPIIYRPDARRPFGHSRITRTGMELTNSALRTLVRSEIASEFYSVPQKYVTGLSQDAEKMNKWKASMSAFMQFSKDEEGDKPQLGQFQQQSMAPFVEHLRMLASLFAGDSGLTLDDLGFPSDNPSSAEAIKASHENLRLTARKAQRTFGSGFLNAGYLAACVRDDYSYLRNQIYLTKPVWEPIFEPDAATLSSIGDGAIKINQAVPGYFDAESLRNLTGIAPATTESGIIK